MKTKIGKMNTNSTNYTNSLITCLFSDLLSTNVVNVRQMGIRYDSLAETYFTSPTNDHSSYFTEYSFDTVEELEKHLKATVEQSLVGIPAELFLRLAELAFLLKDLNTEQAADVSPLVYTLY
jgi:hypothetical protein